MSVLLIAGLDSSGGAGISIDEQTAHALSCNFHSIITAHTIQSTEGVHDIEPVSNKTLQQQLACVDKQSIQAIKIGMLYSQLIIDVVSEFLDDMNVPIILDPVLAASNGGELLMSDAFPALQQLFSKVTLVTPNKPEATILNIDLNNTAVLLKGGHDRSESACDTLFFKGASFEYCLPRLSVQLRGTGCRLSTAIACYLGNKYCLKESIKKAKQFVYNALLETLESACEP